jgi:plastocyanin
VRVVTDNSNNTFVSKFQTVALGDGVQFTNEPALFPAAGLAGGPGQHNVAWDARDFPTRPSEEGSTDPWTLTPRTFTRPGVYPYYCTVHGGPGGFEMSGRITVRNADGSIPRRPAIGRIATAPGRGRVTLRFTSSTSGVVTGTVSRKQGRSFRRFGSLRLTLRRGRNTLTVTRVSSGRRLGVGTYRVALTFSDGISNLTTGKTLNFTISR